MFSTTTGVAVASKTAPRQCPGCSGESIGPYYLAGTVDGGVHWTVTGRLPSDVADPFFASVRLAFANPDEGYLDYRPSGTGPPVILYTTTGGRTWSTLHPPATRAGIESLIGTSLWVGADICPSGVTTGPACKSGLLTYTLGHPDPDSEMTIPVEGVPRADVGTPEQPDIIGRIDATTAVVREGGEGGPTSLQLTDDSGQHWQPLPDPCGSVVPEGVVVTTPGTWTMYCSIDGGLNQGHVEVYTTTDQGRHWAFTAQANPGDPTAGTIPDTLGYDLTASGNGQDLWLVGNVVGLIASADAGAHWTNVFIQTDGAQPILATAGATEAWLPTPTGLYHTTDGTTWSTL